VEKILPFIINFNKEELGCYYDIIYAQCSFMSLKVCYSSLIDFNRMKKMPKPSHFLRMLFNLMMPLKMKASDLRI